MTVSRNLAILALLSTLVSQCFAQTRTWTDITGKFTVEAEFVDVTDGSVRLRKNDGSLIVVPLKRLRQVDGEHVQSHSSMPTETVPQPPMPKVQSEKVETTAVASWPGQSEPRCHRAGTGPASRRAPGEMRLCDMVRQLAANHEIPVVMDCCAFDDVGIANMLVTVGKPGVSLEETLNDTLGRTKVLHGRCIAAYWPLRHNKKRRLPWRRSFTDCCDRLMSKCLRKKSISRLRQKAGVMLVGRAACTVGGASLSLFRRLPDPSPNRCAICRRPCEDIPAEAKTPSGTSAKPIAGLAGLVNCEYVEVPLEKSLPIWPDNCAWQSLWTLTQCPMWESKRTCQSR